MLIMFGLHIHFVNFDGVKTICDEFRVLLHKLGESYRRLNISI